MGKIITICLFAALMAGPCLANNDAAKAVLGQSTTNPFCSSGYDGPNPYERSQYQKPDPSQSICEGMDVVDCYRERYKRQ